VARLARAWDRYRLHGVPPLDNSAVDETAILNRWIHQHIGHAGLVPLGATMDDPVPDQIDWLALARLATGIDPAALTAPPPQPAVDEEEASPVDEPADPDVAQRHPDGDFAS
jgi:hypothetical protein